MAATRKLLLKLEQEAHRSGWDSPDAMPRLFQVDAHHRIPRLASTWCDGYTDMLHQIVDSVEGNVGLGMLTLAEYMEMFAHYQKTGESPEGWRAPPGVSSPTELRAMFGLPPYVPGTDLFPTMTTGSGFAIYGLGMRCESWMVSGSIDDIRQARIDRTVHLHPQRVETRSVTLVGRDGILWSVSRIRGHRAYAHAALPETFGGFAAGAIPHALGRVLASGVQNPFPIRPIREPQLPTQ